MKSTIVAHQKCEYQTNPIGIDAPQPRLSWSLHCNESRQGEERGVVQSAYQVLVADALQTLDADTGNCWDSGRVASGESIHQAYQGRPLTSGQRYYWKVRVWDRGRRPSPWSEPAFWEMGLLSSTDWVAHWIEPDIDRDRPWPSPASMLRQTFRIEGDIRSARAYATSLGLYELWLNGRRVGDQLFTPGWTSYHKRLQYQTYDVTQLLRHGDNAVGAVLGDGWYRGRLGWENGHSVYGEKLALRGAGRTSRPARRRPGCCIRSGPTG